MCVCVCSERKWRGRWEEEVLVGEGEEEGEILRSDCTRRLWDYSPLSPENPKSRAKLTERV